MTYKSPTYQEPPNTIWPTSLIVVITGSRSTQRAEVEATSPVFDEWKARYHGCTLHHGAASGADSLVASLLWERGWLVHAHPVTPEDWRTVGRSAGIKRNADMLRVAMQQAGAEDARLVLVSLWDGESPGTAHMMKLAHQLDVEHVALGTPPPPYPLINHPQLF